MKRAIEFIRTINLYIGFTSILALLIVILLDFYLFHIPELFVKAHEIGNIVYNICMSIMAATVFYILTNHYKEYREKKHIYPYIKQKLGYINNDGVQMFRHLAESAGIKLKKQYPSNEELDIICKTIHPLARAPLSLASGHTFKEANWKEYFNYIRKHSLKFVGQILNHIIFLDPKLIEILNRFEENDFFHSTEFFTNIHTANVDLYESHKEYFIQYILILKDIENYKNDILKHY